MSLEPSEASDGNQQSAPAKADGLTRWSEFTEKIDKILSFLGKVITVVGGTLWFTYGWLRDQVLVMPQWQLLLLIVIVASIGLILWFLAYSKRNKWNKWAILLVGVIGGLCVGLVALFLYIAPETPKWQRLDVPQIIRQTEGKFDVPIVLMRNQLLGRNKLIPGGNAYNELLHEKRGTELLAEHWAGYYAPLVVPSTMPKKVTLKSATHLNPQNASLGVYLFVWNEDTGQTRTPLTYGYSSLQHSVEVPIELGRHERAAMMVFVYPWNADASKYLPNEFEKALSVE